MARDGSVSRASVEPQLSEPTFHPKVPGNCYVEFVLEHSPSVSIRLRLFPSVLHPSIMFLPAILSFSVPFLLHPCSYYVSVLSVSSFQLSTLGSDPFSVSSDLAFILFLLLFGYNPYQPNPIALRFLIVFCPLLSYDPCILIVPMLKRPTDAEPNARKTDGTDGSELRNTLEGTEHGKEAEKRNI